MAETQLAEKVFALSRRQIVGNISAVLFNNLTSRFAATIIMILVARQVGPSQFGHYAASIALARVSAALFSYGLDNWLLHRGSKDQKLQIHAATCFALKAGLGLPWFIGLILFTQYLDPAIYTIPVVIACGLLVWFDELTSIAWTVLRTQFDNLLGLKLTLVTQCVTLLIVGWMMSINAKSVLLYIVLQVISSAICALIALYAVKQRLALQFNLSQIAFTLRSALPFALSLGLSMVYGQADITLVAHYLGKESAGIYSTASGLLVALAILPYAIYSVMLPLLNRSGLQIDHRWQRAKRLFLFSGLLAIVLGLAVYISATPLIVILYGKKYLLAGQVLSILGGVLSARCLTFAAAAFLTSSEIQWQRIIVQAVASVVNISLNISIIHDRGIVGVAQVYVLSEWILVFGYLGLVGHWLYKARASLNINPLEVK